MRRNVLLALLVLAAVAAPGAGVRAAEGTCAPADHAGGDWPSYGRDLANSRHQTSETTIDASNAVNLGVAWSFPATGAGALGGFQSTPVIAGGCLYAAAGDTILAVNADTGDLVWQTDLGDGGSMYALSVVDGRVHAGRSRDAGGMGVALDAATGDILWESEKIEFGYETSVNASAVVADGMQIVPTQGPDADNFARPGIGILDADTGELLTAHTVIPPEDLDAGAAGGGIWATPVVADGFAYTGTANPYSNCCEHDYDNALIKVDLRRASPTFGRVVDHYKGNVDQYIPGLSRQPVCEQYPDITYVFDFSLSCVQLDVDFGASPNLFTTDRGRLILGDLQKSGVYHAVYADTMAQAWTTLLSSPSPTGNSSTSAYDGTNIYANANPGVLHAIDKNTGRIRWSAPTGGGVEYHPASVANGIVYFPSNTGVLHGFDATTGLPVLARSLVTDTGDVCATLGGGVAIARNTVYAVCDTGVAGGSWIVAYSL